MIKSIRMKTIVRATFITLLVFSISSHLLGQPRFIENMNNDWNFKGSAILGLVNQAVLGDVVFDLKNVQNICESFVGEMEVPYPWFSSKTFEGKPLYEWAREFADEDSSDDVGERGQEVFLRPMTKLSIQKIDFLDLSLMSVDDLQNNIVRRIAKVKGDFRQENILNEWNSKVFAKNKSKKIKEEIEYPIIKIRVRCGSGSYMRTLAELIGDKLKVPALAYSIKRLGVGEYRV